MKNRLDSLPEDVLRKIWKYVYDGVIQEINDFLKYDQPYIFRKPTVFNKEDLLLAIEEDGEQWEFRNSERYYNGNRQTYFLSFPYAFLHLKKHPTGFYNHGLKIEYVEYEDEEE
jgi:hypothetical protein